jgi:hypothetical protein
MVWRADSWRELWDAISDPRATYQRHVDREDDLDSGDCLPVGTYLLKDDYTFCRIEDINIGDRIIGNGKPTKVVNKWFKGALSCIEIKFNNCNSLVCTPDHKLFLDNGECVLAKDLKLGDCLLQPENTFPLLGDGRSNANYGNYAHTKQIIDMRFNEEDLHNFLEGLSADCSHSKRGSITYNTVSRQLALQIRVLYRMLGVSTSLRYTPNHGGLGKHPIYRITPRLGKYKKPLKVTGIDEFLEAFTYDIATESGYIYLPESDVVVHNCDDQSLFAVNRIKNLDGLPKNNNNTVISILDIGLLSCPWITKDGKISGHNVGIFKYFDMITRTTSWAYISNWFNGKVQWNFNSKEDIVRAVLFIRSAETLGWAYADLNLHLKEYHWTI